MNHLSISVDPLEIMVSLIGIRKSNQIQCDPTESCLPSSFSRPYRTLTHGNVVYERKTREFWKEQWHFDFTLEISFGGELGLRDKTTAVSTAPSVFSGNARGEETLPSVSCSGGHVNPLGCFQSLHLKTHVKHVLACCTVEPDIYSLSSPH